MLTTTTPSKALKEFSKTRLRKRIQSNILRRPDMADGDSAPGPGRLLAQRRQFQSQRAAEAQDALYLIREETAIMKKLNHPNLVALIEVLDDPEEDSLYMVLEMCPKGVIMKIGLDEEAQPYSEDMCRTWFRDLILGIEYCEFDMAAKSAFSSLLTFLHSTCTRHCPS